MLKSQFRILFGIVGSLLVAMPNVSSAADIKVGIFGAGIAGIAAACQLVKEGITDITILEQRGKVGGVFRYSAHPAIPSVGKTTMLTSSRGVTEIPEFPYTDNMNNFPSHWDFVDYIEAYAKHCGVYDKRLGRYDERFGILSKIRFNVQVTKVEKSGLEWLVASDTIEKVGVDARTHRTVGKKTPNDILKFTHLIVSTGLHAERVDPRTVKNSPFKNFTGKLINSAELKEIRPEDFEGKSVLIDGGSETASDQAIELVVHAKELHWAIRRGQHFFKKRGKFIGNSYSVLWNNEITDYDSTSDGLLTLISPPKLGKPGMKWGCNESTCGSIQSNNGHNVPAWENDIPYFHMFINKSADILYQVNDGNNDGKIIPHTKITRIEGNRVYFSDRQKSGAFRETFADFDIIITAYGYRPSYAFLPAEYQDPTQYYDFVFHPKDPSLALVGAARPVITSMPVWAYISSRWIARAWAKRIPLEDEATRIREQAEYNKELDTYFNDSKQERRMRTLVEPVRHSERLLRHLLTDERTKALKKKLGWWHLWNQAKFKYFTLSGTRKIHLALDDDAEWDEFLALWEKTGKTWVKGYKRRILLDGLVGVGRVGGAAVSYLPTRVQNFVWRGMDSLWSAMYEKDHNTVYLTHNPSISDEVKKFHQAIVLGDHNNVVEDWSDPEHPVKNHTQHSRTVEPELEDESYLFNLVGSGEVADEKTK